MRASEGKSIKCAPVADIFGRSGDVIETAPLAGFELRCPRRMAILQSQSHQGVFFKVLVSVELKEFFQVVGTLVEQRPDTSALEASI